MCSLSFYTRIAYVNALLRETPENPCPPKRDLRRTHFEPKPGFDAHHCCDRGSGRTWLDFYWPARPVLSRRRVERHQSRLETLSLCVGQRTRHRFALAQFPLEV